MRRSVVVVVVSIVLAMMTGTVFAADTITKKAGDYTAAVTIDRNPPIVGKNNVDISVKDSKGATVTDAKVALELSMAPMPGMPAANLKSNAELKGQSYKGVIEPNMAGPWNLAVKISRGGKTETVKLTLDVK